jgi:chaperonin cofactor prefoldin
VVQDLQRRLQEARSTEEMLPAQIDELQQRLQREFGQLQSREAGEPLAAGACTDRVAEQ